MAGAWRRVVTSCCPALPCLAFFLPVLAGLPHPALPALSCPALHFCTARLPCPVLPCPACLSASVPCPCPAVACLPLPCLSWQARRRVDDQIYVLKLVPIVELSRAEQKAAINEVQLLAQMDHDFVVRYYDSFIEGGTLHMVMEWCDRGDLAAMMKRARERRLRALPEDRIWLIFLQMSV